MKRYKYLLGPIFFVYIYFFGPDLDENLCSEAAYFDSLEINDTVVKKAIDKRNHGYRMITLSKSAPLNLTNETTSLYDSIQLGDILIKQHGESSVTLVRGEKASKINLEIYCDD